MKCLSLNDGWIINGNFPDGKEITMNADVPCSVHSAMMKNKIIENLYYRKNADEWMWIEEKHWRFEKTFEYNDKSTAKCVELEFEGLDTFCNISLNGEHIAFCDDFHLTHTIDVTDLIKNGTNKISIDFIPHSKQTENIDQSECNGVFSDDRIYVRRMQCTFGWDWVHRLVSMGIWRNVNLYTNRFVKIECLQAVTHGITHMGADLELSLFADVKREYFYDTYIKFHEHYSDSPMARFTVKSPDGSLLWTSCKLLREKEHTEYITVDNPLLWYPNGYGESPLYTLSVDVTDEKGEILASKTINFGIRDIHIAEVPDKKMSDSYLTARMKHEKFTGKEPEESDAVSFIPVINDTKIMCKGGNWVPADPFAGNVPYEKLEELIKTAHDGGINMLRVWGGGYFESDEFYSLCDKYGIMIQQDFMMACGEYPYDDDIVERHSKDDMHFTELFRKECEQNVARICYHPCIVWYNGDNENQMWYNANYINASRRLAYEITYPSIRKYDKRRRFMSSSPTRGSDFNTPACGMFHATGFLDFYFSMLRETDMKSYREDFGSALARFSNETPVMSMISEFSLRRFVADEDLELDSKDVLDYHTKNHPAPEYRDFHLFDHMSAGAQKLFGPFENASDRMYKMNLLGFEWTRVIMESYRQNKWYCAGNLFWMYNDCWPAIGWAMVDYYCNPKCGYYAMKKCCRSICAIVTKEEDKIRVTVSNDGRNDATGTGTLCGIDENGKILFSHMFDVNSTANMSEVVFELQADEKPVLWVCDIKTDIGCDRSFYFDLRPQDIKLPSANVTCIPGDGFVTLKTDEVALYVTLDGECKFENNCFMLMPGEEIRVNYEKTLYAGCDEIKVNWLNRNC